MFGHTLNLKKSLSPRNIVFSPHVDDETIGCFSLLYAGKVTDVVYFYDLTPERIAEAEALSRKYGFTIHVHDTDKTPINQYDDVFDLYSGLGPEDTIYVPTSRDEHYHHKMINSLGSYLSGRGECKIKYYTVDMTFRHRPLSPELQEAKKNALKEIFPSQRVLLENNEKYALFEGIFETEILSKISYNRYPFNLEIHGYSEKLDEISIPSELWSSDIDTVIRQMVARHYVPGEITMIKVSSLRHRDETDFEEERVFYG